MEKQKKNCNGCGGNCGCGGKHIKPSDIKGKIKISDARKRQNNPCGN